MARRWESPRYVWWRVKSPFGWSMLTVSAEIAKVMGPGSKGLESVSGKRAFLLGKREAWDGLEQKDVQRSFKK